MATYEYVTFKVTGLSENVIVSSSDELYSAYYNQNGSATSGSFYAGFPSNPNVSLNLVASALGSCISSEGVSNVTFEVSNSGSYDTLQWIKKIPGTDTYSDIEGETNTTYKPLEIGTYAVRGTITCTGSIYKSSDIPISICPTDLDNDGIVDNLDLDNDNDGILNAVESLGNGIINVSLFFLNSFTSIFLIIDSLIFNLNVLVIKFTPFNSITLSNLYFFMIETSFFLKEIFDFTIVKFS